MPVELHIRRWPENSGGLIPIPLDEWKAAVEKCENIRLCTQEYWINPVTQKWVEYKVKEGDVEVFDGSY